jgi:predicted nucleic acid-binding protein
MSDSAFYDTNVLACAHDASSPHKQERAQDLIKRGLRERTMTLSTQVFSEFYIVATPKLRLDPVEVLRELHVFSRARVVEPTLAMVFESIGVARSSRVSYWDALIAVSAAAAGCAILYTEDLNHGQEIAGVRVVNPFLEAST